MKAFYSIALATCLTASLSYCQKLPVTALVLRKNEPGTSTNLLAQAEENFAKALSSCPEAHLAYERLGFALTESTNRSVEAEYCLRLCVRYQPQRIKAAAFLAHLLRRRNAPFEEIELLYRQALARNPNHELLHGDLGTFYLERGQLDRAVPELQKAVELAPAVPDLHINLGLALAQYTNRQEAAEAALRKAVELTPDSRPAIQMLALLLTEQKGRETEAQKWVEMSEKLQPDDSLTHRMSADLLSRKAETRAAAERHYRKSIELAPEAPEPYVRLGDLLAFDPKRNHEAKESWRKALQLYRRDLSYRDRPFLLFGATVADRIQYLEKALAD